MRSLRRLPVLLGAVLVAVLLITSMTAQSAASLVRTPHADERAAEPLPAEAAPLSAELRTVLRLVNRTRAAGRTCGGERLAPVPPLRANARLSQAASSYAGLMARRGFFSHTGPGGSDPGDRISAEGYRWRAWGENIAAGQSTARAVVRAWLRSPGHCRNLMGRFREIGLGHVHRGDSAYGHYWVQDFATPR